jgi:hypothetical protein
MSDWVMPHPFRESTFMELRMPCDYCRRYSVVDDEGCCVCCGAPKTVTYAMVHAQR